MTLSTIARCHLASSKNFSTRCTMSFLALHSLLFQSASWTIQIWSTADKRDFGQDASVRPPHVANSSKGTVCWMWTWDVTRRVSTPPKSRRNAGWWAFRRPASQEIYAENATALFRLKRGALSDRNLASAYIRRTVSTKSILRSMIILMGRMKR